jgi:hypothetical protein
MEKEKMKMKNVFMLLLGAMLVLGMAGVVSADQNPVPITNETYNTDNTVDVKVTLALSQSFEVTIPADIELNNNEDMATYTGNAWLNATVHLLNPNTALIVNVSSNNVDGHQSGGVENYWNLKNGALTLQYIIASGDDEDDHDCVNEVNNWVYEGKNVIYVKDFGHSNECLHFKLYSSLNSADVGTYTDTLTFGVYLIPINS